jgi:hypothetical protein
MLWAIICVAILAIVMVFLRFGEGREEHCSDKCHHGHRCMRQGKSTGG